MIKWVNKKTINNTLVSKLLSSCEESRIFTNGGSNVRELEDLLKKKLEIDDDKEVICVCNGACGLTALIGGINEYSKTTMRFAVQAFTFPCSVQSFCSNSIIIDFDSTYQVDIDKLIELKDSYDCVIITNCFGHVVDIDKYESFCNTYDKILLFDNAASPFTFYKGRNVLNYGTGTIISLHHTKPLGFGEGGAVIVDKKYSQHVRKCICFGYSSTDKYHFSKNASNYKMSEISAIYILQWLQNFNFIISKQRELYLYFKSKAIATNYTMFPNYGDTPFTSCIPIIFNNPISLSKFHDNGIEAKKYYYSLSENAKVSKDIFDRIICLPLNIDMTTTDIDKFIAVIDLNT